MRVNLCFGAPGPEAAAATAELFEPFQTFGPTGNIGLGLTTARALVRVCGGELELTGPAAAQFTFTLPRDPKGNS